MNLTFGRSAQREVDGAAEYYEIEQPGLGAAFIDDLVATSELVAGQPRIGRPLSGGRRIMRLKRFPYLLRTGSSATEFISLLSVIRSAGRAIGMTGWTKRLPRSISLTKLFRSVCRCSRVAPMLPMSGGIADLNALQ
jgi:plasmid stabilization system protein ParE